jgi:hypothetical protein
MPYIKRMSKTQQVTADLNAETMASLERLAGHMDCSVPHLVATAVYRFVKDELPTITPDEFAHIPADREPDLDWEAIDRADASFDAFIKVGEDDVEAGRFHTHEEVEAIFRAKWEKRDAA